MSLVNDSLKFTSSDTQICWNFLLKKMWVAFAVQKLLTFFSTKNIRILYIESAKTVNEMTLNVLVKLTTLWTTGPCSFRILYNSKFFLMANSLGTNVVTTAHCISNYIGHNSIRSQLHPLFWGPCLLGWTFWFVIRLRIYEIDLWLGHHDQNYSRLSLSRPHLSRITAYLEVKFWSLF